MTTEKRVHWHLTPNGWNHSNIDDDTKLPEDRVLTLEITFERNSSHTTVIWTNGNGEEINSLISKFNLSEH
ncbi:hypothetical protein [Pseudoalteromonas sp. L1]|uniref:hypothetical protein n=1 Tax=Pseudoalteromonas sp. L1 TaxID=195716 RepID=UPI001F43E18E|nr:hypothetical protein [Pseudoalteromonas sp. L1]